MSPSSRALLWFCALALVACGTAAPTGGGNEADVAADVAADVGVADAAQDGEIAQASDTLAKDVLTLDVDAAGTDASGDAAAEVDTVADADVADSGGGCEFPGKPLPGEPGSPCASAGDCDSGACVDGPSGKICTSACSSCCPTGFKCELIAGPGGDSAQYCMPKWNALCRPCLTDAECGKVGKDALCVVYADGVGSFCGGACAGDSDCPAEFACQSAQGEAGAGKQCVRVTGMCGCSPQAVADGAHTVCSHTSAFGTCTATRKCTTAGLDACTAQTPAAETCGNAMDDNCNGVTDESGASGCITLWSDSDGDGEGSAGSASQCLCAPLGLFTSPTATDCDDGNKAVNSAALEICDGVDNNCNGQTDEGCDDDGDGWCDVDMTVSGDPLICKKGKKDCDDANAAVNPGAQEVCGNGIDDDCDGLTDSGPDVLSCVPFYADSDGDGFGAGDPVCLCSAKGSFTATATGDCADSDPQVHPGAAELCGNAIDDNCNGVTDEAGGIGCSDYFVDLDGDGFGTATPTCLCGPDATYSVKQGGDCDDGSVGVNPSAVETCNGVDDNCNGATDEFGALNCTTYFVDSDGDGFGNSATNLCLCQKSATHVVTIGGDCNDDSSAVHVGALELCDGLDNDCDGLTDEADAMGCTTFYGDGDGDGWGNSAKSACLCASNSAFSAAKNGDCDDGNAAIHPDAPELCDGVDNNCVGGVDEAGAQDCAVFFLDQDGDGYGVTGNSLCLCGATDSYSASKSGDCNDAAAGVHPKALEACDGIDNDCDGVTDPAGADGCTSWYADGDGDGYGANNVVAKCLCVGIAGYANQNADCADGDPTVHPGATEVCNGKDDDCDGVKDPKNTVDCVSYYIDADFDGYGASGLSQCQCGVDGAFNATTSGDCNDANALIHPGVAETCDGVDNNCVGGIDEGLATLLYYTDADKDGYGTGQGALACGPFGTTSALVNGDCNDANAAINPGQKEICANSIDDNCSGSTDENCAPLCTNGVAYDFNASTQGWTLASGWGWTNWLSTPADSYALTWFTAGSGYASAPAGSSATIQLLVPHGLKSITVFGTLQNVLTDYCTPNTNCTQTSYIIDAQATFSASLGASKVTIGPYATHLVGDARKVQLVIPVDASAWDTTQTLAITVTTPNASTSTYGGYAFDNVTWTCQ